MKFALFKKARRDERSKRMEKHQKDGKLRKSVSSLPESRKSIKQGGAIGMYTAPFSTIQEGSSVPSSSSSDA
jgi:hypothetical protein